MSNRLVGYYSKKLSIFLLLLLPSALLAKDYKGAEMITRSEYKYGAVEARIRAAEGSGMVTAFFYWKHDSELEGTEWQEQDFEIFGKNGRFQTQIMTPGDPRTENVTNHALPTLAWDNYYTYRMEWTPEYMAFYVDGVLVRRSTDPVRFAKHLDPERAEPAQIRLSLWAGDAAWSGEFDATATPAATLVDYFEVYTYNQSSQEFELDWRDDFNSIDDSKWWFANWTFEHAVNDYVRQNATTIDGKLVLALTDNPSSGQFQVPVYADNAPIGYDNPPVFQSGAPTDIPEAPTTPVVTVESMPIPGRVEAEDFFDYFDTTEGNQGDASCTDTDVDAELTNDVTGGCNIGWTSAAEWLSYQVDAEQDGLYALSLRAAGGRDNMVVSVEVDGTLRDGITIPLTGWRVYEEFETQFNLSAGEHVITIRFDTGRVNLNWLDFNLVGDPVDPVDPVDPDPVDPDPVDPDPVDPDPVDPDPVDPDPVDPDPVDPDPVDPDPVDPDPVDPSPIPSIPGRIEAEDFDGFFDRTSAHMGSQSCDTGEVDAEATRDVAGGGCNIGWTESGEWLSYQLNVAQAGLYELSLRTGAGTQNGRISIEVDGALVDTLVIPVTGWTVFDDVPTQFNLTAGEHTVRVLFDTGQTNLNWLDFSLIGDAVDPDPVDPDPVDPDPVDPDPVDPDPIDPDPVDPDPVDPDPVDPPTACTIPLATYEGENMTASTGGQRNDAWNIWSNGDLSTSHQFAGNETELTVFAAGDLAGPDFPHMVVRVGGVVVGDVSVMSDQFMPYQFVFTPTSGNAEVSISFDNDYLQGGEDRNLIVDAILLDECF